MTAATVQNRVATRKSKIDQLAQNFFARRFFFEKEGRTPQHFNRLQRAWEAVKAEAALVNPGVETRIWHDAQVNTVRQLGINVLWLEPDTFMDGSHINSFRPGYQQPELVAEVNDLYAALGKYETDDDDGYDGTDYRALARYEVADTLTSRLPGPPHLLAKEGPIYPRIEGSPRCKLPARLDVDRVTSYLDQLADMAMDEVLDIDTNGHYHKLRHLAWLADMAQPLEEIGQYQWVTSMRWQIHVDQILFDGAAIDPEFVRDLIRMDDRRRFLGMALPEYTRSLTQSPKFCKWYRKRLMAVAAHFYDFSDSLEDPQELIELKDARETQLIDHKPDAITPDLSLQLRHQGWTFNRKATVGVGTAHPLQRYFHMSTDVFYAHLRLREAPFDRTTHKPVLVDHFRRIPGPTYDGRVMTTPITRTTKELMPVTTQVTLAHLPKVKLADLIYPTAYKVGADGKKAILPHHSIDNYVRALVIADWHDYLYGTSYFDALQNTYRDTLNFAPQVIELAIIALAAMPRSIDQFYVKLYAKEDAFLRKHNYGYFHSRAQ